MTHYNPKPYNMAEIDFHAQDTIVTVVPRTTLDHFPFLCQYTDKQRISFKPNQKTKIPLWLALKLQEQKIVRIPLPQWMLPDSLTKLINQEKSERAFSSEVPFHYVEVGRLMILHANHPEDEKKTIEILLSDLEDIKLEKMRNAAKEMLESSIGNFNSIACMELNQYRTILAEGMKTMARLDEDG